MRNLKLKMSRRKKLTKELKKKIFLCIFLGIVLILDVIYIGLVRDNRSSSVKEESELNSEKETEVQVLEFEISYGEFEIYFTEESKKDLREKIKLLDGFSLDNESEIKIFYACISEKEESEFWFFAEGENIDTPIMITQNYVTNEIEVAWSLYDKAEILDEVWNGNIPDIQDIPEE